MYKKLSYARDENATGQKEKFFAKKVPQSSNCFYRKYQWKIFPQIIFISSPICIVFPISVAGILQSTDR